jgi:Mg2+ and Co2+ transporter CorA
MTAFAPIRLGLIWGFDMAGSEARALSDADLDKPAAPDVLRWVHLNLADQRSRRWIEEMDALPAAAREAVLGADAYQRALLVDGVVVCTFHDLEREFGEGEPFRMAAIRILMTESLVVTARTHPVCCADMIRQRLATGTVPKDRAGALDLLVGAILEVGTQAANQLIERVQRAEDVLIEQAEPPEQKVLTAVRRRAVLMSRQLGGLRAVLERLEEDEDIPEALSVVIVKLAQRAAAVGADVIALQSNLRQLREELDLIQAQRTNQNLYVLSLLSALLLPATLVTGLFGMNVHGLPFSSSHAGGIFATALAGASAFAVYLWLRAQGLFRR